MIPKDELDALNSQMEHAFATGDQSELKVLGYGEITTVVLLESSAGAFACKRLPPFENRLRFDAYRLAFDEYVKQVNDTGVKVIDSWLQTIDAEQGIIAYCVQPALTKENLATNYLADCTKDQALSLVDRILQLVLECASESTLGLDGQLSNWILHGEDLLYLDVTTPLLRNNDGTEALDTDLFLAAAPMGTRGLLKRFVLKDMLDKYHSVRGVILDLLGNLIKEDLEKWLFPFMYAANKLVEVPYSEKEIRNYYLWDARIWIVWQALRSADRWAKMKILRRPYPFLLPGKIERNV